MNSNQDEVVKSTKTTADESLYYRVEIIGNMSVYRELLRRTSEGKVMQQFSTVQGAYGTGSSGSRMGDAVWPEENFICITYCVKEDVDTLARIMLEIKHLFQHEGIKMFAVPVPGCIIH